MLCIVKGVLMYLIVGTSNTYYLQDHEDKGLYPGSKDRINYYKLFQILQKTKKHFRIFCQGSTTTLAKLFWNSRFDQIKWKSVAFD